MASKTSTIVDGYGSVWSTSSKIDGPARTAELNLEADLVSGANPTLMSYAAQTVTTAIKPTVKVRQVGDTSRWRLTLTVTLRPIGNLSNEQLKQMAVSDVLRAIENIEVSAPPPPPVVQAPKASRRTGKLARGNHAVVYQQPQG